MIYCPNARENVTKILYAHAICVCELYYVTTSRARFVNGLKVTSQNDSVSGMCFVSADASFDFRKVILYTFVLIYELENTSFARWDVEVVAES